MYSFTYGGKDPCSDRGEWSVTISAPNIAEARKVLETYLREMGRPEYLEKATLKSTSPVSVVTVLHSTVERKP